MNENNPIFRVVPFNVPDGVQVIAGQSTFNLLAVEELYKAVSTGAPKAKFGIAFSEGSDNRILRNTGNEDQLKQAATHIVKDINAGHYFVILMNGAFPLQVLNNIKQLNTTVNVQVASGNKINAIVADLQHVSSVIGFTDGLGPKTVETPNLKAERKMLVRQIGYLES